MNKEYLKSIADILNGGGIILKPTDTILGIGGNALNEKSFIKISELKKRPLNKGFVILMDSEKRLESHVEVPQLAWEMMDISEKPLTFIYSNPKDLPEHLLAQDGSIAIRLTSNKICQRIIQKINAPLISTSANLSGLPAPKIFKEVHAEIKSGVDLILEECLDFEPEHPASSIIKLEENGVVKVIRE